MKFIDVHSHVYPEAIARKATQAVCEFYDLHTPYIGTPEEKLAVDKQVGIEKSVLLPVAVLPKHVHSINSFTHEVACSHGEFIPFATVHADCEDILAEAALFEEMGFKGVKIHPDMQKFDIDEPRLFPLYDFIQGRLPLIVHSGDPRYGYSHPEKTKRILKMFPRLTVIAAHMGGWSMQETALSLLGNEERCFVDTSSSLSYRTEEEKLRYIYGYGVDRVLFGTDFPVEDPIVQVECIKRLHISDDDKEKIAYKNTELLLELTP